MNELYMKQMYNMRLHQSMLQAYARMMLASNIPGIPGAGSDGGGESNGEGGAGPAPINKKTIFTLQGGTVETHDIMGTLDM